MYCCDGKALLLQSSVSHAPSEFILKCWFAAQETFPIIINVKNSWTVVQKISTVFLNVVFYNYLTNTNMFSTKT